MYWDINQRAAVGETILHMCFLNATRVHYDLSKIIIKKFPCLVNDIYLSDEYYGKFCEKIRTPYSMVLQIIRVDILQVAHIVFFRALQGQGKCKQ